MVSQFVPLHMQELRWDAPGHTLQCPILAAAPCQHLFQTEGTLPAMFQDITLPQSTTLLNEQYLCSLAMLVASARERSGPLSTAPLIDKLAADMHALISLVVLIPLQLCSWRSQSMSALLLKRS